MKCNIITCTLPLGVLVSAFLSFLIYMSAFVGCPWVVTGNTEWGFSEFCNNSRHENCSSYLFDDTKGYIRDVSVLKTIGYMSTCMLAPVFMSTIMFASVCISTIESAPVCSPLQWTGKKRYMYPSLAATPGVFLAFAVAIFAVNYQSDSTLLQYGTPTLAYGFWLQVAAILSSCTTVFLWWISDLSRPDVPSTFPSLLEGFRKTVKRLRKTNKSITAATRKKQKTSQSPVIALPPRSTDYPAATTSPDVKDLSHLQKSDVSLSTYGLVMFPQRLYQHSSSPPPPYEVAVVDVNVSPPSYRSLWSSRPSVHHDTASTVI